MWWAQASPVWPARLRWCKPAWTCVTGTQGAAQFLKSPVLPRKPIAPMPLPVIEWVEK